MTHNIGNADRVIRIIVGIALLSLIVFLEGAARWWGLLGLIPLATVVLGWCPAWSLLGINTRGKTESGVS
ncbi:MAG: DUF2892 domain-containing protein [Gammaproteobacteria bacterium]|nr:DUF2892 domain-containing protein [Gammaproteobacteria bacterium]